MKNVPLRVRLSRVCEFIQNKSGAFLHVTLVPKTKSVDLQWGGDGPVKSVRLVDILKLGGESPQQEAPKDWGRWVRLQDLKSEVAISPGLSPEERGKLMSAVDRITLHREWMSMPDRPEWDQFLSERGRKDFYVTQQEKENGTRPK